MNRPLPSLLQMLAFASIASVLPLSLSAQSTQTITGQNAFTDYSQEHPGVRRKITVADLPAPAPEQSVDNGADMVPRPDNAWPQAPRGFKVELYAQDFKQPRYILTAPNGDLFVADSAAGEVKVLRGVTADGKVKTIETYASDLDHPFGIAFYPNGANPKWIYIANTTSVVRFPYKEGDLKATAAPETIVPVLPGYAQLRGGGHWTRDVVFSKDGQRMFVSVGSGSNIDDPDTHSREFHRADVLEYTPEGKFVKIYAYGIRNCVGEAINPITGQLWCSTNERDQLGNNLVPDYITHIEEGGFYGWPWYYIGDHPDPRLGGKHPELKSKVIVPDVLLQPHFASLEMTFYDGKQFPSSYDGDAFAAEHGSWNRNQRAGYEVIRVPMKNGHATGEYEDFLTGFVRADGKVWGRPVGVSVAKDGSLFVSDDGTRSIWHVVYTGK
ncbi:MAG TPA: sorbosone dehydrogenase family protein [Edaphobacter sp.]|uniref:PQQ-dependent sugar dehydrogenase n=1 Tax=Edaphobacter sp. TaxID=1934404 RepID=UPI002D030F23|nr:sorbosone dehydrogenase family protein [Edaphobacter sp.]HUZ93308.1 sorbosone dehydrogenase family protein [Edaphobacter sp.]